MTDSKVIRRLCAVLPRTIGPHMRGHGRCVAATRIGIDVLARFGIAAEPLPVTVLACNAKAVAWFNEGGPGGTAEFERRGCYMLTNEQNDGMILRPPTRVNVGRTWDGHLIVHVPARREVIDLDLRQLGRPEFDLVVPDAMAFPWNDHVAVLEAENGAQIMYKARTDALGRPDREYETASDWTRGMPDLVALVERQVRESKKAPQN